MGKVKTLESKVLRRSARRHEEVLSHALGQMKSNEFPVEHETGNLKYLSSDDLTKH